MTNHKAVGSYLTLLNMIFTRGALCKKLTFSSATAEFILIHISTDNR